MTKPYPHLPNAPIVEAVFDIRCRLPEGCESSAIETAVQKLKSDYPVARKQLVQANEFKGELGKKTELKSIKGLRGVQIEKQDKKQIVQMQRDGFSLNRLRPYTSFDELMPEVMRCWQIYAEATKPAELTRIALRTINRIELPMGFAQAREAFQIALETTFPDLKQTGFLHRWSLAGNDCFATVTLATRPPAETTVPVVLDIDAYKTLDLDSKIDALKRDFSLLRELKNDIFFGSLTAGWIDQYK